MIFSKKYILLFLLFSSTCLSDMFNISLENDFLYGHDRYYTHGTRFLYIKYGSYKWFEDLNDDKRCQSGYSLAQYMYTPSDISIKELLPDDRPYGGWLYIGQSLIASDESHMSFWELDAGVVGPSSRSDETQMWVHKILGSKKPMGWKNQIKDEFGCNLIYQSKNKIDGDKYDIISNCGGCIGNVHTYFNIGSFLRLGYNIPDDFGLYHMEPTTRKNDKFYSYVFFSTDAKYVVRNIFLDGNSFKDSHSVEKRDMVFSLSSGVCIYLFGNEIIYMYNYKTEEFYGQMHDSEFGSIYLTRYF